MVGGFEKGMVSMIDFTKDSEYIRMYGKKEGEMLVYKENPTLFEDVKTDLLGEQFKIIGRVKRNEMFDRLEFNAQIVEKAKPEEEITRLESVKSNS